MSFEDELKKLRKRDNTQDKRLACIEGFLGAQGYQPPSYGKPITEDECKKIGGKWNEETQKCELEESIEAPPKYPQTKEACEEAGGTWNEETKVCKLPKEALESLRGILPSAQGVLPISGIGVNAEEAKARAFVKKVTGE